jgi:hypothetical protein
MASSSRYAPSTLCESPCGPYFVGFSVDSYSSNQQSCLTTCMRNLQGPRFIALLHHRPTASCKQTQQQDSPHFASRPNNRTHLILQACNILAHSHCIQKELVHNQKMDAKTLGIMAPKQLFTSNLPGGCSHQTYWELSACGRMLAQ